jgi:hypothetical protein
MKIKRITTKISNKVGFLLAGIAAFSFQFSASTASAQILLTPPVIPMAASIFDEVVDGMPSTAFDLTAGDVKLRWFASSAWSRSKSAERGISLEFKDTRLPALKLQFGLYRPGAFASDLDDQTLLRYLADVEKTFVGSSVEILNEGSTAAASGAALFLSGYYRCLFFKVTDSSPDTEDQYVCDLLTILPSGHLLVLREKGPQRPVSYSYSNLKIRILEFMEH